MIRFREKLPNIYAKTKASTSTTKCLAMFPTNEGNS